ncbi:MAG: hypothetical protein R3B81_14520 [bacterium]
MVRVPAKHALPVFALVALVATMPARAAHVQEPTTYKLRYASDYQHGCLEPCACPITESALRGTFDLIPMGREEGIDMFRLAGIEWRVSEGMVRVTGSGELRVHDSEPRWQRLEADLRFDGESPIHFDSGVVPVTVESPEIDVSIARNGFYCLDRVFAVRASPGRGSYGWAQLKAGSR